MTTPSAGQEAGLNPQPLPPGGGGPAAGGGLSDPWLALAGGGHPQPWLAWGPHPDPWRPAASAMLAAIALGEAARRAGDDRLVRVTQDVADMLCPPPKVFPVPEPGGGGGGGDEPRPITWPIGLVRELLGAAATLPASPVRDGVLARGGAILAGLARGGGG